MPKCKNDQTRSYKGNEPSPKGLGYCAHAEKIGKVKKGLDGNKWIVSETKNGTKRWVKNTKKQADKPKEKLKKYNSVLEFYDVKTIKPKNLKKYISTNKLLIKLVDKIIPEIKKNNINIYLVPLPISDHDNIYWTDYPHDYITEFFDSDYFEKKFIYFTVYLTKDLKINTNKNITITYDLDIKQLQLVYDILNKHLPYQYSWDGNDLKIMKISFDKKSKKNKSIKVKKQSDYPKMFVNIMLVSKKNNKTLFEVGDPQSAKELSKINDLKKISKFMDFSYGDYDIDYVFYGIKDIKTAIKLLKKFSKKGIVTYDSHTFKIEGVGGYGYMFKEDPDDEGNYFEFINI